MKLTTDDFRKLDELTLIGFITIENHFGDYFVMDEQTRGWRIYFEIRTIQGNENFTSTNENLSNTIDEIYVMVDRWCHKNNYKYWLEKSLK